VGAVDELAADHGALVFLGVPVAVLERGTDRLRCDLAWGAWDVKHGHLRSMDTYDAG
jgi:hypothetical protein